MQRSFLYLILLKTPVALFQQFIDFFVVLDVLYTSWFAVVFSEPLEDAEKRLIVAVS